MLVLIFSLALRPLTTNQTKEDVHQKPAKTGDG